jgi:hypothetical protein
MGTNRRTAGREGGKRAAMAARGGAVRIDGARPRTVSRLGHTSGGGGQALRGIGGEARRSLALLEASSLGGGLSDVSRGKIPNAASVSSPEDASGHSMASRRRTLHWGGERTAEGGTTCRNRR